MVAVGRPTPTQAVALWQEALAVGRGFSPHTVAAYGRDVTSLFVFHGGLAVPPRALERWLADRTLAPRSKARRLTAVRQFFAFAMEKGWVNENPAQHVVGPKLGQSLPKALSQAEVVRLLEAPQGTTPSEVRLRLILQLLYACGLRVSELAGLSLHQAWQARADGGALQITGKGGKTRLVPLGPVALETLETYLDQARPHLRGAQGPWLLAGPQGKRPLTRVRLFQLVKEAGARVGIAVAPHHLRHTFATHLLDGAADLRAVQLMLGHASLNTTQIYTKLTAGRLQAALEHHPLAAKFGKRRKV